MSIPNPFDQIAERLERIEECLAIIKRNESPQSDLEEEPPITITEAAEFLRLSKPTIYGLTHRRKIPSYRQGKQLYFFKSELLVWLRSNRRSTIEEMKNDDGKSI
jgi:excisionase family DNA binding protein